MRTANSCNTKSGEGGSGALCSSQATKAQGTTLRPYYLKYIHATVLLSDPSFWYSVMKQLAAARLLNGAARWGNAYRHRPPTIIPKATPCQFK